MSTILISICTELKTSMRDLLKTQIYYLCRSNPSDSLFDGFNNNTFFFSYLHQIVEIIFTPHLYVADISLDKGQLVVTIAVEVPGAFFEIDRSPFIPARFYRYFLVEIIEKMLEKAIIIICVQASIKCCAQIVQRKRTVRILLMLLYAISLEDEE